MKKQNDVEVTAYGTMKFFDRTARLFRIFTRNGFGASARLVHHGETVRTPR